MRGSCTKNSTQRQMHRASLKPANLHHSGRGDLVPWSQPLHQCSGHLNANYCVRMKMQDRRSEYEYFRIFSTNKQWRDKWRTRAGEPHERRGTIETIF